MGEHLSKERQAILEWLNANLIGPVTGNAEEIIRERPSIRYLCAILYPRRDYSSVEIDDHELDIEDSDAQEADGGEDLKQDEAQGLKKRYYVPPSAVSLSFLVTHDAELDVVVSGARYEVVNSGRGTKWTWKRFGLPENGDESFRTVRCSDSGRQLKIWDDRACIYSLWRPHELGFIVTVSLANLQNENGPYPAGWEESCIFQARMECWPVKGRILRYPQMDETSLDDEEREIELRYRDHGIFGVGHGVAVDWDFNEQGQVKCLKLRFLPSYAVPKVTAKIAGLGENVLSMDYLAGIEANLAEVLNSLHGFIGQYDAWIAKRRQDASVLSGEELKAAQRILDRCCTALDRMRQGLKRLETDDHAVKAFAMANLAVARQIKDKKKSPQWYPFQLGFLLINLETLTNEDTPDRDTVDLLWFPTGGGKTEAYLALIAFLICYRRMRYPDKGGGTAVIMRYTLRLLTTQQFVRASGLICALELLRRQRSVDLGQEPISLGLWVGGEIVPNTFLQASNHLDELQRSGPMRAEKFILYHCPAPGCGAELLVPAINESRRSGLEWSRGSFRFVCPNPNCELNQTGAGDGVIPVNVIDQHLYQHPPSLLMSTVDKFALFAWKSEPNAFFGRSGNRPPELIIQDELHLISGELGTIYGLYEAAVDTVIELKGVKPKYIASTATIRHAAGQVKRLYGREVFVFPPPGLYIEDSFFARTAPISNEHPGRLYVGYLAPGRKRQESLSALAATLLTAPPTRNIDRDIRDAWWTLLIYHGSLKGVGNSNNTMRNDVPELMKMIYAEIREKNTSSQEIPATPDQRELIGEQITELTSNIGAGKIPVTLGRMAKKWTDPESISALLCTNMISVGIDVDRLALMIVNGQPLTTGEYIQASSRVGRGTVPGLVVANYFRNQARSLSHYENFRAYHESFYRFVEPTSVTPFSAQARKRALHAAVIIVMRQAVPGLLSESEAGRFDYNNHLLKSAKDKFWRRCKLADPAETDKIKEELDAIFEWWEGRALDARQRSRQLTYSVRDRSKLRLIQKFEEMEEISCKPTLMSMRHVDDECGLQVVRPRKNW